MTDVILEAINHLNEVADKAIKREQMKKFSNAYNIPTDVLSIPGVLQDGVDLYNETAKRYQPQFAVSTMLAVGATCMGRRFVTNLGNYPSIFEIIVGETGCGKEHGITVSQTLLQKADLTHLIGGPGYSSASAVITALQESPSHFTAIDEFGEYLKSINKATDDHKKQALTMLMQVFGRLGGMVRPPAHSKLTLTEEQREKVKEREVYHPAITLLGLTTATTLYDALSSEYVASGFLNRFLIVETPDGVPSSRSRRDMVSGFEPSEKLLTWMKKCASTFVDEGNMSDSNTSLLPPNPKIVPFSDDSLDLLDEWEEMLTEAISGDDHGLAAMYVRTIEIAQRIALIVAVSCGSETIEREHTEWALNFVDFYADQTVGKLKGRMSNSPYEASCKEISEKISAEGNRGMTLYELQRKSSKFAAMTARERADVQHVLESAYHIVFMKLDGVVGKPRSAFVALDEEKFEKYELMKNKPRFEK